ncbi:MAG: Fic family protein [Bacteroidales bacterium]|nr:Fic family protein [Bacteroidales bacterium]
MDKFQSKLNFQSSINHLILREVGLIDCFKGKWNAVEQCENDLFVKLKKSAAIESAGSSTRIEGIKLSDKEVAALLNLKDSSNLSSKDEQEVFGYYEALKSVLKKQNETQLSHTFIQELHLLLLKYSVEDNAHRGKYKTKPNRASTTNADGSLRVIFNTTEPSFVNKEMTEIIDWVNLQLKLKKLHPLLIVGLFVYEFLSIHPFQDANGPLSRLLTVHLLNNLEYRFIHYTSLEKVIEKYQNDYFKALQEGQINRYSYEERVDKWILFFVRTLSMLANELEHKYNSIKSKKSYVNPRQKKIIAFIKKNQPIKLADLDEALADISINTLKKDLIYLKTKNRIRSEGKNRGATYSIV